MATGWGKLFKKSKGYEPETSTNHGDFNLRHAYLQYKAENGTNLWDQTWGKLNEYLGGGKVQIIYPFIDWTWRIPPPGYIDATAYSIVNQMPQWSAICEYAPSATGLYSAYKSMLLNCVDLSLTPHQKQQKKDIEDQLNAAQNTLTRDRSAMQYDFAQARKVPPGVPEPTFEEWYQSSGWDKRIEVDEMALDKLADTLALIVAQENPQYKEAIDACTLPTDPYASKPGFAKSNVNGNDEWRAAYTVANGEDWVTQIETGGGNRLSLALDASQSTHHMKESWAGGASGYGFFFGAYAEGKWQDMQLSESDSSVRVEINIEAVTQVPVRPGQWYNSGYLKVLASKNRWNPPYTTKGGSSPVFGKGGLMPLMITGMVVGYNINFKITMHSSTFHRYKSLFEASGGIRIGPFHIGGSGGHRVDNWTRKAENNTFSGSSTADYPFVIGFIVAEPGLQ